MCILCVCRIYRDKMWNQVCMLYPIATLLDIMPSKSLAPEKALAPHSSTLAWRIPWMEETGGLQSMGLLRVRHDWVTSLLLFTFMHWRRKWQPTPVFLPGESQGWGRLVGCHLWDCKVGHDWSDSSSGKSVAQNWTVWELVILGLFSSYYNFWMGSSYSDKFINFFELKLF